MSNFNTFYKVSVIILNCRKKMTMNARTYQISEARKFLRHGTTPALVCPAAPNCNEQSPRHGITKGTATFEGKTQKCSLTVYFQYMCHLSQGHVTLWGTSLGEGRLRVYTLLHLWGAQENTVACEGPSHLWKQQKLGYSHVLADTQKQAKDESQAV